LGEKELPSDEFESVICGQEVAYYVRKGVSEVFFKIKPVILRATRDGKA